MNTSVYRSLDRNGSSPCRRVLCLVISFRSASSFTALVTLRFTRPASSASVVCEGLHWPVTPLCRQARANITRRAESVIWMRHFMAADIALMLMAHASRLAWGWKRTAAPSVTTRNGASGEPLKA